jgi:hypothetical protein
MKPIDYLPSFKEWPNTARTEVLNYLNELIKIVNSQQEEIKKLKKEVSILQIHSR